MKIFKVSYKVNGSYRNFVISSESDLMKFTEDELIEEEVFSGIKADLEIGSITNNGIINEIYVEVKA